MRIVQKLLRIVSAFGLLLLSACGTNSAPTPTVGESAPHLNLPTLDEQAVQLADLEGSVVIVNFWATWCPPCVEETPRLVSWAEQYHEDGLRVVGVDTLFQDSRAKVEQFVADHAVSYPVLLDQQGDVSQQWQARNLPRSFVIDRDGVVRFIKLGELTDDDFESEVLPLLDQTHQST